MPNNRRRRPCAQCISLPALGVFVDGSENIFIADYANFAIREVVSAGTISTVAGTLGTDCETYATTGCGDEADATSAQSITQARHN